MDIKDIDKFYDCTIDELEEFIDSLEAILQCRREKVNNEFTS